MIYLDGSVGSWELESLFRPYGVPVTKKNLVKSGGDAFFVGNGPKGDISIAIERKRIPDLIDCMQKHRLTDHQLPLLQANYDVYWLIVEGIWRCGGDGELVEWRGKNWYPSRVMYRNVDNYLTSLQHAGMLTKYSSNPRETVAQIVNLYRYYQKPFASHTTIAKSVYNPEPGSNAKPGGKIFYRAEESTPCERFAYLLPEIGSKQLYEVQAKFKNIKRAVNATVSEWLEIPGIGKITAARIQDFLTREKGIKK